jgi:hypothetical protein
MELWCENSFWAKSMPKAFSEPGGLAWVMAVYILVVWPIYRGSATT